MPTTIRGTDSSASAPAITGADSDTGVYFPAANQVALATNGTQALIVDSNQNVGIGTSSPTFDSGSGLQISRSGVSTLRLSDTTDSTNLEIKAAVGAVAISGRGNYPLLFETNGNERARIDSSGNLLVGATSGLGSGKQVVAYAGNSGFAGIVTNNSEGTGGSAAMQFRSNGTQYGSITTSSAGTAFNTSSDYRLKENIQPMTGALATVAQLKPVTYTWKADGSEGEGFIAHELQEVVPQCVTGEKDAVDADGNPVYQGIDTSFLVATLTAAIQELNAKVEAQAAEIEILKQR